MAVAKSITVIIPFHNEAENIPELYRELRRVNDPLPYKFQYVFIDDGSSDASASVVQKLSGKDKQVRLIELTRNFGKEVALTAGLHQAKGDAAIMIDADLQHPPALIPRFIKKWERGADIVVGVRKSHAERWYKRSASSVFYKVLHKVSQTDIIPHETDYRLVDHQVITAFNAFTEHSRITRGLFDWLGYDRDTVPFDAPKRTNGNASYGFKKRIQLAVNSLVGHSLILLRLAGYIGVVITLLSGLLGLFIFIERYVLNDPLGLSFSGPAILAVIILFLIGIVLTCLGFISLYIAQIHQEVINRPIYVVKQPRRRR